MIKPIEKEFGFVKVNELFIYIGTERKESRKFPFGECLYRKKEAPIFSGNAVKIGWRGIGGDFYRLENTYEEIGFEQKTIVTLYPLILKEQP